MKTVLFALGLVGMGCICAHAQDTTSVDQQQYPVPLYDQDRERINSRDLPDPVKRALENEEYRGWLINAAYKTTGTNFMRSEGNQADTIETADYRRTGQEVYVVELKNGAQTRIARFTEEGEPIDDQ